MPAQLPEKYGKPGHYLSGSKIIFLLFLLVFATTYPKYLEILADGSPATTYSYYFEKIRHPFLPSAQLNDDSHKSKMAFRLTVPLLGKALGIGSGGSGKDIVVLYLIQSLLLLPFLYMLLELPARFTSRKNALLFAVGCSFTYLCKAFFWDYDFWFDAYAYFFILAGLYFRNPLLVALSLFLAAWTDERAFTALPGVFLFHLIQQADYRIPGTPGQVKKAVVSRECLAVVLAGFLYLLLRVLLTLKSELWTPVGAQAGVSLDMIPYQFQHRLIGVFLTFEGLWLIPAWCLFLLFSRHKAFFLVLLLVLCAQVVIAYSVYDITRSMAYSFPVLIIFFALLARNAGRYVHTFLPVAAMACLLIPTQFLIFFPRQIPTTLSSAGELIRMVTPFIRQLFGQAGS